MEATVMVGSVMLSIGVGLAVTKAMLSMVLSMMERADPRLQKSVVPVHTRG